MWTITEKELFIAQAVIPSMPATYMQSTEPGTPGTPAHDEWETNRRAAYGAAIALQLTSLLPE